MMKHIFIIAVIAVAATSCMEKYSTDVNRGVEIAKLDPLANYTVPVREGFTSVVTWGDEILAVTRQQMNIQVPVAALQQDAVNVEYSNEDIFGEQASSTYWQYLSFEDTPNGDGDYNDVVLHCRVNSKVPWNYTGVEMCKHIVSVQPVALGGSRTVALGIIYRAADGSLQEKILTDDIRRDIFFGIPEFPINTNPDLKTRKVTNYLTDWFTYDSRATSFPVVWFIEVSGVRLYAASTNFDIHRRIGMISEKGIPYGLSLTTKWRYPIEKMPISEAYPGFNEWLRTGVEDTLLKSIVLAKTFPATIYINPIDRDLWAWSKRPDEI